MGPKFNKEPIYLWGGKGMEPQLQSPLFPFFPLYLYTPIQLKIRQRQKGQTAQRVVFWQIFEDLHYSLITVIQMNCFIFSLRYRQYWVRLNYCRNEFVTCVFLSFFCLFVFWWWINRRLKPKKHWSTKSNTAQVMFACTEKISNNTGIEGCCKSSWSYVLDGHRHMKKSKAMETTSRLMMFV